MRKRDLTSRIRREPLTVSLCSFPRNKCWEQNSSVSEQSPASHDVSFPSCVSSSSLSYNSLTHTRLRLTSSFSSRNKQNTLSSEANMKPKKMRRSLASLPSSSLPSVIPTSSSSVLIVLCSFLLLQLPSLTSCASFPGSADHRTLHPFSSSSLSSPSSSSHSSSDEIETLNWNPQSSLCDRLTEEGLGMESKEIPDSSISASSSYNEKSVGPLFSRLNSDASGGAWCPHSQLDIETSGSEWIQVNLTDRFVITAVSTQGRFGHGMGVEFVEEYWLEYSRDYGMTWFKWKDRKGTYILKANTDTNTIKKNSLDLPVVGANMIRIVPFSQYMRTVCLRFEIHGCPFKEDAPIEYSMPDGFFGGRFGDLIDDSYDGLRSKSGVLSKGMGQLFDGIKGHENYKINAGFEWIGWKAGNDSLDIDFVFPSYRNLTSATFHVHNLFRKSVEVFSSARVFFSFDGKHWSQAPLEFEYMPDHMIEAPRDVVIHLHHKIAKYVKFSLKFASKWLLMSEASFDATSVSSDYSPNLQDLESAAVPKKLLKPRLHVKGYSIYSIFIFIGIGLLALSVSGVLTVIAYRFWLRGRKWRSKNSKKNNFYSVDVDFFTSRGDGNHPGQRFIGEAVSTPVYCEPEFNGLTPGQLQDSYRIRRTPGTSVIGSTGVIATIPGRVTKIFESATASNASDNNTRYNRVPIIAESVSNSRAFGRNTNSGSTIDSRHSSSSSHNDWRSSSRNSSTHTRTDHEYAVPDVIYKDSTTGSTVIQTSRLISNPLQDAVDGLNALKGTLPGANSSSSVNNTRNNSRAATLIHQHQQIHLTPNRQTHSPLHQKTYAFEPMMERTLSFKNNKYNNGSCNL